MRNRGATVVVVLLSLLVAAVAGLGVGALLADEGPMSDAARGPASSAGSTPAPTPPPSGTLTARASSTEVAAGERVVLAGELTDGDDGLRVVVQRQMDGQWQDFPASTTTQAGGSYELDIELGQPGENLMRVTVPDTGAASEPVAIQVG